MHFGDAPIPARVARLPRDARGYPIPAITPRGPDGLPVFAVTGNLRTLICAVERRCSICGTPMAPGPVYRVVGADEAAAATEAIASGRPFRNDAPTPEPPGHRVCMLFAATVCPFLARPNARRSQDAVVFGTEVRRGDARGGADGIGGALAGFAEMEFRFVEGEMVQFRFSGLREFLPHEFGAEQVADLAEAVAADADADSDAEAEAEAEAEADADADADVGDAAVCPPYLLDDEAAAERHAATLLSGGTLHSG